MEIFKTDRLSLQTWTENDLSAGLAIWGDPEVMRYVDSGAPLSVEAVERSIQAAIKHQHSYGFQHWAVIERASGKIIGACGFNRAEQEEEIELVFHFGRAFWNKGFATEAARACIDYAKERIKPKKIIAGCHPKNEASKAVLRKIGFSFIGNRWFKDTQQEEPYFELVI